MYFYITTAKGTRINHGEYNKQFMADKKDFKTIKKGDKCLVFCNGTIGQGRVAYNYSKDTALEMLSELMLELTKLEEKEMIIPEESSDYVTDFCTDDIPF